MQVLIAILFWVGFVVFLYLLAGWFSGIEHVLEAAVSLIITFLVALAATFVSLLLYLQLPFGLALPVILAVNIGNFFLLYLLLEFIVTVSRKWAH